MHAIESNMKCRNFMLSHNTNKEMFVFQDNFCSHEARDSDCGQVPRRGAGPISTNGAGSLCVYN